jgi:hypothetical protein
MTTTEIIREITNLDPIEQAKIVSFAYRLDAERQLSGDELAALARRMVSSDDPSEKATIREQITRGFYGRSQSA